ncbi:hypothetical protein JAAARDRAFT_30985 [Jaapia argillacea MUCL 33604]|uniref:Helicase C-terminal domain-containing protein n=1 Tax=Jaapia argillacea MUCL 33604 TaxID=933084 RepID=A0A067Q5U5_9AGAM|nr:hypothetical protein JAAARDRAFT_30985 [Jaapia argillacea MUCL 33604]
MAEQPTKAGADASSLPPINAVPAMFSDLVGRIPDIKKVIDHVQGRKLRVATMCSGTESPLLALDLIRRSALDQYGVNLEIDHVFSCEIEPFKQAYIERNFHPPILFRDVCELDGTHATTAYGALVPVPGDVDILIAGTSCVDYSNLNNEKQDIDANGESGRTFRGMMSWVKTHRPPLVILENVCGAPWDKVCDYFAKNRYSAKHLRLDTKNYYIPHTRTRVYLLAVNEKASRLPEQWASLVTNLKRPASSTLDAFLLPSDDPRIHQSRQKLVQESFNGLERRTGRTDWNRCESRHQRARLEEGLGPKRPLTGWEEGGFCKMPDFSWNDWGVGQVERVWDLMDITTLRKAKEGIDPSYKTQVWNLSQNVDRNVGFGKEGICPCLTPSMIPYITNRGGPMVGLEALSMQGLPIDELLLTRETEDQLADLAGNAMSTTVVGACMLAALVVGRHLIKAGDDSQSYESKADIAVEGDDNMEVDSGPVEGDIPVEDRISGKENLLEQPLDLTASGEFPLQSLLANAQRSIRLCQCEGRKDMTDRPLQRCKDCGSSACTKCSGRPEHNYEPIDLTANPRLSPTDFAQELKAMLPMRISIAGVTRELLDGLKDQEEVSIPKGRWDSWAESVLRAVQHELHFVEPKRQEVWTTVFHSPTAVLELFLHPQRAEWRLFAKPEPHEPASADIRKVLEYPVARYVCSTGLFVGTWELALPHTSSIPITIEGAGELVPSWEARLGLQGEEFKDRTVWSQLRVIVPEDEVSKLDRDISGTYSLLDKCGTANGALHLKTSPDDVDLPPLFMLLDPARCGDPKEDSFVFTISTRRYEFGESRPVVCKLESKWRQSDAEGKQNIDLVLPCKWAAAQLVHFKTSGIQNASYAVPRDLTVGPSSQSCRAATALLVCKAPSNTLAGMDWPVGTFVEVDKVHERTIFRDFAWMLEPVRTGQEHLQVWQDVEVEEEADCRCSRCAPAAPAVQWTRVKNKIVPMEDPVEAGQFERSLKVRPAPFVTQVKIADGCATIAIGVNFPTLLHRARSRLPTLGRSEPITMSWRLDTDFTPIVKLNLPKFTLTSNRADPEHPQPPHFKIPLRPEQQRSLGWMLKQEAQNAPPFIEEEIAEAILEPLGWRAEGRSQRPVHIRGGVLADEVGYGKTAITLGLIDYTLKDISREVANAAPLPGKIAVKGTLSIVPPHLTRQWGTESVKFMAKHLKVVLIHTASTLNSIKIEDMQEADMIVVASNLFKSSVYLANLESFAGAGELPSQEGRYFEARLQSTLHSLHSQVDRLRDEGAESVMKEIKEGRRKDVEAQIIVPVKRQRGKNYLKAVEGSKPLASSSHHSPPKTGPSGKIMEVLITVAPKKAKRSIAPTTDTSDDDHARDRPRPKRGAAKKSAIVISDDEDDGTESNYADSDAEEVSEPNAKKSTKKDVVNGPPSSDYDEDSAEETPSEQESDDSPSVVSDPGPSKSKSKAKAKPTTKAASAKQKRKATSTDDDSMDVSDDVVPKAKNSRKRKSDGEDDGPPKAKKRREDSDPWGLESRAVKNDWTQMQAPPLEMFHFARKVVDEYTYLEGKSHSLVTALTADRHWVLSGTPPVGDFGDLKTISAFLNLHLGVDDDAEGQSALIRKRRRDQTAVEKFHSFREVHSMDWHAHRHGVGQAFLDRFVRQNIAEIDEIPSSEKIEKIDLPAAERAIYLELEHHLRALDMTIKRGRKNESDREKRLAQALGDSKTAEEALLKRCSHFELDTNEKENALKACEVIVKERTRQLKECKAELLAKLKQAVKDEKKIGRTEDESMFQEYVRVSRTEGAGDKDATEAIVELLDEAGVAATSKSALNKLADGKMVRSSSKAKGKGKDDGMSKSMKELIWDHREKTHEIRRLTKELVGRVRSLRYFTVVRDLQRQREAPLSVTCPLCDAKVSVEDIAVLSSCGHTGCYQCVYDCAVKEECVAAESAGCKAAARVINVVRGNTLGVDEVRDGQGKHFGLKLERVIHLIKKRLPKEDRVLIFVQFPDLMKKVADALTANHVKFLEIRGNASQKSKNLEKFQNESEERVLLLNVTDESASGANLTSANHAIFLSPLLTTTQEIYNACETQAIGRVRRYGQEKHVYVWRFLSTNTIDEEIFEQRTGRKV